MKIYNQFEDQLTINPIYGREKHERLSDKYKLIETDSVIDVFKSNGLDVIGKSFAEVRKDSNAGKQKHVIIFSSDEYKTSEGNLQLLLTNSHDGSSAFQLDVGFFRAVCANGLVSGDSESTIKIRHTGNCLDRLDAAVKYQLERLPLIAAQMDAMKQIELDADEFDRLVEDSVQHRLKDNQCLVNYSARRYADYGSDLWTALNVAQELVIKGGGSVLTKKPEGNKYKKLRAITSVTQVSKFNKLVWNEAIDLMDKVS